MTRPGCGARVERQREFVGGLLRCYPVSFLVLAPSAVFLVSSGRPDPQWRQGMRHATARYPRRDGPVPLPVGAAR